jgi:hypothetical protein
MTMAMRQQSPQILDSGSGKTAMASEQQPPQQLWQDSNIGALAISFNLAARHP